MSMIILRTLECEHGVGTMALDDEANLVVLDYDMEAELAAAALGLGVSECAGLLNYYEITPVKALMRLMEPTAKTMLEVQVAWNEHNLLLDDLTSSVEAGLSYYSNSRQWAKHFLSLAQDILSGEERLLRPDELFRSHESSSRLPQSIRREDNPAWASESMEALHYMLGTAIAVLEPQYYADPELEIRSDAENAFGWLDQADLSRHGPNFADAASCQRLLKMAEILVARDVRDR